ncbi:MAG TPA: polysaccharide deacetylase family protein [Terracidiphilus sp.]
MARALFRSGASHLLSQLPERDTFLVLNYHRIGNADEDLFDRGVFSATADEFDDQIAYLKKHVSLLTLEEALSFVDGTSKDKTRRCRVLVTFDDGYLDNYNSAFPILRSHGVQGVFFLVTSMVGSCHVPWWDQIAYLLKTARRRRFSLHYPTDLIIDLDANGLGETMDAVLKAYKRPENSDPARFMRELAEETKGDEPSGTFRRFLNWDEAREMSRGGMAMGSHTHSHPVLSQLSPDRQCGELSESRAILEQQLGIAVDALAYPVGHKASFSAQTQRVAQEAGYRVAFSHYGGANMRGRTSPFDVKRTKIVSQSASRFRVQTAVGRFTGSYWP